MVTIREVAKDVGVSVATASRALNGMTNVTRETREKIEAAAKRLNYIPHSGARSLTRRTTDTIGVILPDLFGEFFSEMIRGIDMVVHGAGKNLLLGNMHGSADETGQAMRAMRGRVDGLLVMPLNSSAEILATPEDGDALAERGVLYAPDYVVNAGGIINVCAEYLGWSCTEVEARTRASGARLAAVLDHAERTGLPSHRAADALARAKLAPCRREGSVAA